MRIVGGRCKGLPLEAPHGKHTRPTIDRVRESMASMVLSALCVNLDDVCVLDAFAGSGALGLELLSRGARSAVFCETHALTRRVLQQNVQRVVKQTGSEVRILPGNVFLYATQQNFGLSLEHKLASFHVVMLDPPYATEAAEVRELLSNLNNHGLLAADAVIIYEHLRDTPALEIDGFDLLKSKHYGTVGVDLLRKES